MKTAGSWWNAPLSPAAFPKAGTRRRPWQISKRPSPPGSGLRIRKLFAFNNKSHQNVGANLVFAQALGGEHKVRLTGRKNLPSSMITNEIHRTSNSARMARKNKRAHQLEDNST